MFSVCDPLCDGCIDASDPAMCNTASGNDAACASNAYATGTANTCAGVHIINTCVCVHIINTCVHIINTCVCVHIINTCVCVHIINTCVHIINTCTPM